MFLLCIETSAVIESNSLKGISFISEVKRKALSRILLIKLFDVEEQNVNKSGQ